MDIRTFTLGFDWQGRDKAELKRQVDQLGKASEQACASAGIRIRTRRVVVPPMVVSDNPDNEHIAAIVRWLSELCAECGIRWFCVPFEAFGQDMRGVASIALEIARRFDNAFINLIVAKDGQINREGILHTARLMKSVSRLSNNGYHNFRLGASFQCDANGPFFPFTWHEGCDKFAIGVEMVPTMVEVIATAQDRKLETLRETLLARLVPELAAVEAVGRAIEASTGITYAGLDASLAPFPDSDEGSVARIIELLGVDGFGSHGTLFLTSFLTDLIAEMLQRSAATAIGFNGVMYSLLEDTRLGINAAAKEFTMDSLLAYATMCGCGVDMVPVPGDVFEEELASIMMDVAAIATRLDKPLGARILPVPGGREHEFTKFCYDFLHNTRIQKLRNRACFSQMLDVQPPFSYLGRRRGRS